MFNFDDKKFFGGDPCGHHGHFPHEKPRYTMTEEVEHTAAAMRETIDRLLRFEERCKADFDGLMKNVTSDNVIFKTTMREAWATFIQEVKNEINVFEGNVDATVSLFQKDTESNYAKLSEEVYAQIAANLADFNGKVAAFEAAYVTAFEAFKDVINSRIENYNDNHAQTFADYQVNVGLRLDTFEGEIREAFNTYQDTLNSSVKNFKETWSATVENRLDNQDARISDAEMYMKSNLSVAIENLISEMESNGEVTEIVSNIIAARMSRRMEVINDSNATEGVVDFANFAGQGGDETIYGVVVHNYTDSPAVRVDHVGTGSILQLVNARNAVRRPDKGSDFHGTANPIYYIVQNDSDGDGSANSYPIFYVTKDGHLYFTGWDEANAGNAEQNNPVKFVTNKNDGGTWAFVLEAAKSNAHVMNVISGGHSMVQVKKTDDSGNGEMIFPQGMNVRSNNYLNIVANDNIVIQTAAEGNNAVRFRIAGEYFFPAFGNRFCTSATRPTANVYAGEIYMETDTNRTIRRNSANTGWVDLNGDHV